MEQGDQEEEGEQTAGAKFQLRLMCLLAHSNFSDGLAEDVVPVMDLANVESDYVQRMAVLPACPFFSWACLGRYLLGPSEQRIR